MDAEQSIFSIVRIRQFFLFSLIIFISYSNTFHASWQLDDKPNILNNRRIQITEISFEQLWQSMHARPGSGNGVYRPVACVTLALNWFFGQRDVVGYHLINIIVHIAAAWFLFLTIDTLLRTPRLKDRYSEGQINFIAGLATLLWALNPLQTQAVTYIVQRMASMAGMFAILSVLFYLKARIDVDKRSTWLYLVLSFACFFLGVFCKENVVALPLVFPVLETLFLYNPKKAVPIWKIILVLSGVAFFCLTIILLLKPHVATYVFNYYKHRPFTLTERVLTEPRVVLSYLSQLFLPFPGRLSIEHDINISRSLLSPWTTTPAILIHLLLLFLAIKMSRRQPLLSLAVLFFYLNHLVESTIVPLELVYEHRNYLPSAFLFLPLAISVNCLIVKNDHSKRAIALIVLLVSTLLAGEGYGTFTRNKAWKTEKTLWLDALRKAPESARPLATLAIMLAWGDNPSRMKYQKAIAMTKRALTLRMSRYYEADQLGNIANLYAKLGERKKAVAFYERSLQIKPNHAKNRFDLAKTLIRNGNISSAVREMQTILNQGAIHADYYALLGFCYLWQGKPEQSLRHLQKALELAPLRPDILYYLGNAMSAMGYYERARWFLNLAMEKGGADVVVALNLIQNDLLKGEEKMAEAHLRRMLQIFPLQRIISQLEKTETEYENAPLDNARIGTFLRYRIQHLSVYDK